MMMVMVVIFKRTEGRSRGGTATARKYRNAPEPSSGNTAKNPPHTHMMAHAEHAIANLEANGMPT